MIDVDADDFVENLNECQALANAAESGLASLSSLNLSSKRSLPTLGYSKDCLGEGFRGVL